METKRTKETLEARVRETPLRERLEQSGRRIGAMCSERRGPRMCIPVEYTDDDFFICTTIRDAVYVFDKAREALEMVDRWLAGDRYADQDLPDILDKIREARAAMEAQP